MGTLYGLRERGIAAETGEEFDYLVCMNEDPSHILSHIAEGMAQRAEEAGQYVSFSELLVGIFVTSADGDVLAFQGQDPALDMSEFSAEFDTLDVPDLADEDEEIFNPSPAAVAKFAKMNELLNALYDAMDRDDTAEMLRLERELQFLDDEPDDGSVEI